MDNVHNDLNQLLADRLTRINLACVVVVVDR